MHQQLAPPPAFVFNMIWRSTLCAARNWSRHLTTLPRQLSSAQPHLSSPKPPQQPSLRRRFVTQLDILASKTEQPDHLLYGQFPVPEGIATDEFGFFEVLHSGKDLRDVTGENALLAVHGPEEDWLPRGRVGHGTSGGMFAIIGTSGTQYKVMTGDVLYTNRVPGEVNTEHIFDSVLAIGTFDWSLFGRPLIRQAKVVATIEEQTKSAKVMVTKFKKRKGYLRRKGHRQPITRFRINRIEYTLPDKASIQPYEIEIDPLRPNLPNHLRKI